MTKPNDDSIPTQAQKTTAQKFLPMVLAFLLFLMAMTLLSYYQQELMFELLCQPVADGQLTTSEGRVFPAERNQGFAEISLQDGSKVIFLTSQGGTTLDQPSDAVVRFQHSDRARIGRYLAIGDEVRYSEQDFQRNQQFNCEKQRPTLKVVYGGLLFLYLFGGLLLWRRSRQR